LARQTGVKTPDGVLIDIQLTRQDLAELSGTTLYSVSRIIAKWEKMGLVISRRAQVVITNAHGLVTIAEDLPK
jgi:CRP-like cAMP-binding protein